MCNENPNLLFIEPQAILVEQITISVTVNQAAFATLLLAFIFRVDDNVITRAKRQCSYPRRTLYIPICNFQRSKKQGTGFEPVSVIWIDYCSTS